MTVKKLLTLSAMIAVIGIVLGLVAFDATSSRDEELTAAAEELVQPEQVTESVDGSEEQAETEVVYVPVQQAPKAQVEQNGGEGDEAKPKPPAPVEPEIEDADGDGVEDAQDNCPDVANAEQLDFDDDGLGDNCDADDDNDGLTDWHESLIGTNPKDADTDGDGWKDGTEVDKGTDPLDPNDHPEFEWKF